MNDTFRMKARARLSSLEFSLIITCSLLLLSCVGLMALLWMDVQPQDGVEPRVLSGEMAITSGATFCEELKNSSSVQFKSLAFDVQHLVTEAFTRSHLSKHFTSCEILRFTQGSILVTFDLWFSQPVDRHEAEQQMRAGLEDSRGLVVDKDSIHITEKHTATTAAPSTPVTVSCPPHQTSCADRSMCIDVDRLCDGIRDCADDLDEDATRCATRCDGQFVLFGPTGWFASETYETRGFCRWIIRVQSGFSVRINFHKFVSNENVDILRFYEGVGAEKWLAAELSGSTPPGTVWLLTDQSTVEFSWDDFTNKSGFNATFRAVNVSRLSVEEKLTCTFEQGVCLWRQHHDDDGDWLRTRGSTFPPLTGPSVDHTLGNLSGFYLVTPLSPGQWLKSFRIHSLPVAPPLQPMCLQFWYHMFGEDVHRLQVLLLQKSPSHPHAVVTVVFNRDGNYGDHWNYGQVLLNLTTDTQVVFEALKKGGFSNDIALDDITLISEPCGPAPPEPTNVPTPTTTPPIPADCGGPFELWAPNVTFSSPNYPENYGNKARCAWTLHTVPGQNIQLHFLDIDVEANYDMVEVRDGAGPNSTLLAVLTGSETPAYDFFSTANQMTVWFFTDNSGHGRGFKANFTSGLNLGSPDPCAEDQYQCGTGDCIHGNSQCDGVLDCHDASDEAECVVLQMNASRRLQFQIGSSLFTVCADTWNTQLSHFTCQYLGHRSGWSTLLPAMTGDSPFTSVKVTSDGGLESNVSETCVGNRVISLQCDNQPCGTRFVANDSVDQSAAREGEVKVVGGADSVKGAWPWMVSLHWKGRHVCGATLLGNNWLLTAAHCVYGKDHPLRLWSAKFGLHTQTDANDVETRRLDRIIINDRYNRLTKDSDIAMMHLKMPVNMTELIQPVCLPEKGQEFPAGRKCFIAGWGRDADGSLPNVLQEALVPLVDQAQCQQHLPEYTLTSNMLCAGYREGGVDSCQGDSGGPLMCQEDGYWTLIGVTSFGIGCGQPERPGVYARVSSFVPWIAQTRGSSLLWGP